MALVRDVALVLPQFRVESGFLEFAAPTIRDGLEKLRQAGCTTLWVIPGTLFSGGHSRQDIPAILRDFSACYPEIQIRYGRAFDVDANLVDAACARMGDAIGAASGGLAPAQTAVLVAGRGASGSEVRVNMQAITRLIQNKMQFALYQTAYAGIASPRVPEALEQIAAQSFRRVIILPYFLFTGMLVKRIYDETDVAAARYPATQFIKASHLNNHPSVIDSFVARIMETGIAGTVING